MEDYPTDVRYRPTMLVLEMIEEVVEVGVGRLDENELPESRIGTHPPSLSVLLDASVLGNHPFDLVEHLVRA